MRNHFTLIPLDNYLKNGGSLEFGRPFYAVSTHPEGPNFIEVATYDNTRTTGEIIGTNVQQPQGFVVPPDQVLIKIRVQLIYE